jgi:hypothetical protein
MAGYLDSKERVLDFVLTGVGKSLLAQGNLRLVYWIPFDDEVDYDPYIANSGTLTEAQLSASKLEKTEEPLTREASFGYRVYDREAKDRVNVNRPMYTLPPNPKELPQMTVSPTGALVVTIQQTPSAIRDVVRSVRGDLVASPNKEEMTSVDRSGSSTAVIDVTYSGSFGENYQMDGFLVTVYHSSSEGYVETPHNRDSEGNIVYRNDLKLIK